ncbi:unnamed protein product [Dicrocoelium dendriticum]|nr:unnamed protein product [Dicrocoelium dendriticum]
MSGIVCLLLLVHLVFNAREVAGLNYCSQQISTVQFECLDESVVLCGIDKNIQMVQKENRCRKCSTCLNALNMCKIQKLASLTSCPDAQQIRQSLITEQKILR